MTAVRRFEALLQKPVRFWEIAVNATTVVTRSGTVGTADVSEHAVVLPSPSEASAHADREIDKHRAAGYVEIKRLAPVVEEGPIQREERFAWAAGRQERYRFITQKDDAVRIEEDGVPARVERFRTIREASAHFDTTVAKTRELVAAAERRAADEIAMKRAQRLNQRDAHRDDDLEAQCLAAPDDPQVWAVYADWLMSRGDPLGEIAGIALGGNVGKAQKRLLAADRALEERAQAIELAWRHGFVRQVTIRLGDPEGDEGLHQIADHVLTSPLLRYVDSVRLGLGSEIGSENEWGEVLQTITNLPFADRIRELRFDAYTYRDSEISWVSFGDFSWAWPKLQQLELLHIKSGAGGTLGAIDLPKCKTFIRESGGLAREEVEAITNADWPTLEHLEIWTGSSGYGATTTLADLRPILEARGLPRLRHLGIVDSELVDDVLELLPHSKVLRQLHSLDLSKGIAANLATARIAGSAAAYRHLASFDLSENLLRDDEVATIKGVLDNVIVNDQRQRADVERYDDETDDDIDDERYVAVGE